MRWLRVCQQEDERLRKLSACLVILLAVIAAVVLAGLIAGRNMWAFIIAYWAVLTIKNLADARERMRTK